MSDSENTSQKTMEENSGPSEPSQKEQKDIAPMDFAEYLRKQGFQRTFIEHFQAFLEMKDIATLEKVDEVVSHWLLVER